MTHTKNAYRTGGLVDRYMWAIQSVLLCVRYDSLDYPNNYFVESEYFKCYL